MSAPAPARTPRAAVGVVCLRGADVLLIKRAQPPLAGRWSLPGGRIEWGERIADAAARELLEETGCRADFVGLIDVVDGIMTADGESGPADAPWGHYILIDYAARWREGEPRAGDDAADARFFTPDELGGLGLWSETLRVIEQARAMVRTP